MKNIRPIELSIINYQLSIVNYFNITFFATCCPLFSF
jgi:hypothetical protein